MIKKFFKIFGTAFALLSFIALFFTWIYTSFDGKFVSSDISTTGFNLTLYSSWGSILVILPFLILGTVYSNLSDKTKTVFVLGMFLLSNISFYQAVSSGMVYLKEVYEAYSNLKASIVCYPILMFFSLLSFYLSYNAKMPISLKWLGIELCTND